MSMVEDFYRTHRSLVERYDQIVGIHQQKTKGSPFSPLKHHQREKLTSFANDNYDSYSKICDMEESGEFEFYDPEKEDDEDSKFDNCVELKEVQFVVTNDVMEIERLGEENKDHKARPPRIVPLYRLHLEEEATQEEEDEGDDVVREIRREPRGTAQPQPLPLNSWVAPKSVKKVSSTGPVSHELTQMRHKDSASIVLEELTYLKRSKMHSLPPNFQIDLTSALRMAQAVVYGSNLEVSSLGGFPPRLNPHIPRLEPS
ncbi:uncharacterized protein HKW66_Vig0082080 [Vigna angularis]|uniref:Uncharacterized protein n=1 Tax=Phaseolus angularis TaxID=3914 RepID=A0A8T0KH64_PHAAN|nr:uncharacterized protein HKW66_Vig0082080 [Vigna angularis]